MRAKFLFASLVALAWSDAAAAQQVAPGGAAGMVNEGLSGQPAGPAAPVATDISPDTAGPLALGTQVTRSGPNYVIDGGTRAGNNLFHSFSRFDLGQGDFARWVHSGGDPASIRNVVNRVTGGDPSDIFGTLDSRALPNADFFFINPAGIVFGAGASIDVPAAAHFSTAQELRFAAGPAFTVSTPGGSTFSVANPSAFGFVGGQGDLSVTGLANAAFTGTRISFTGRNVAITDSLLGADGFGVVGVGSGPAQLSVQAPRAVAGNGRVDIFNSILRSRAADGILVSAGSVRIHTATLGTAFTPGPRSGVGGPIDISGRDVTIFGSLISASTSGAEDAGEIRIAGNDILISGASMIQSETNRGSTGAAGGIAILGGNVTIEDESRVSSSTLTGQRAGDIQLTGNNILIDRSVVASASQVDTSGDAGRISVNGNNLRMRDGSTLTSASGGEGNAGFIDVEMREGIHLSRSSIVSEARGTGGASGLIRLAAPAILLDDRALVSTSTATDGNAGEIGIAADDLQVLDNSIIVSESVNGATGNAGLIGIGRLSASGGRLLIGGQGAIRSDTNGLGDAGGIFIGMDEVELRDGARISSDSGRGCIQTGCGPLGEAGNIRIVGRNLLLSDDDPLFLRDTRISSDTFGGDAGRIEISLSGDLTILGSARISSDTIGEGNGGDIRVDAQNILASGSRGGFSSTSFGTGAGGSIELEARGRIVIQDEAVVETESGSPRLINPPPGLGGSGSILLIAPEVLLASGGTLSASTFTSGDAGSVEVRAGRLLMERNSRVASSSSATGNGGVVRLDVGELLMSGGAMIETDSFLQCSFCPPSGNAGNIIINAGLIDMRGFVNPRFDTLERPQISSDTNTDGAGGNITINLTGALRMEQAIIASRATAAGAGGSVTINAPLIEASNSAQITTETTGAGAAGSIAINGGNVRLDTQALLSSATQGLGAGGSIVIRASELSVRGGAIIDADSLIPAHFGPEEEPRAPSGGQAGDIDIVVNRLVVSGTDDRPGATESRISSSTVTTGNAGNLRVSAGELIMDRGQIRSDTIASGNAGTITIRAGRVEMSNGAAISTRSSPCRDGCAADAGNAGEIDMVVAGTLAMNRGQITSNAGGAGNAGTVAVAARDILLIDGRIASSTDEASSGTSGRVGIEAERLRVVNGSIETISRNTNRAGDIGIVADEISLEGSMARIASSNESAAPGAAGTVLIAGPRLLTLHDGAQITTSSIAGPAGDILISMPSDGLLILQSSDPLHPSLITTSSGPGTGGQIAVSRPRAIISNGGSILALGQQGGANVQLDAQYLISSSDRTNRIEVSGNFLLEAAAYDVSAGTVNRDLSVIDASGVLRGQCASLRASGQVSQLVVRPIGPYGARPTSQAPSRTRLLSAAELQESCS